MEGTEVSGVVPSLESAALEDQAGLQGQEPHASDAAAPFPQLPEMLPSLALVGGFEPGSNAFKGLFGAEAGLITVPRVSRGSEVGSAQGGEFHGLEFVPARTTSTSKGASLAPNRARLRCGHVPCPGHPSPSLPCQTSADWPRSSQSAPTADSTIGLVTGPLSRGIWKCMVVTI